MGYFRHPEHEPIRVRKLNALESRVDVLELGGGGGGGTTVDLDGGDVNGAPSPNIDLDGGGAT